MAIPSIVMLFYLIQRSFIIPYFTRAELRLSKCTVYIQLMAVSFNLKWLEPPRSSTVLDSQYCSIYSIYKEINLHFLRMRNHNNKKQRITITFVTKKISLICVLSMCQYLFINSFIQLFLAFEGRSVVINPIDRLKILTSASSQRSYFIYHASNIITILFKHFNLMNIHNIFQHITLHIKGNLVLFL